MRTDTTGKGKASTLQLQLQIQIQLQLQLQAFRRPVCVARSIHQAGHVRVRMCVMYVCIMYVCMCVCSMYGGGLSVGKAQERPASSCLLPPASRRAAIGRTRLRSALDRLPLRAGRTSQDRCTFHHSFRSELRNRLPRPMVSGANPSRVPCPEISTHACPPFFFSFFFFFFFLSFLSCSFLLRVAVAVEPNERVP